MTTSDCKYCETWCAPCNPYRGVVSDERADPQSEIAALRARIAELEAPVLPETVAGLAGVCRSVARELRRQGVQDYGEDAEYLDQAAALLTRLSSFSEEDVERAALAWATERNLYAISFAEDDWEPSNVYKNDILNPVFSGPASDCREYINKQSARAALTAFLAARGK